MASRDLAGEPHGYLRFNEHTPRAPIHAPLRHAYRYASIVGDRTQPNVSSRAVDATELVTASTHPGVSAAAGKVRIRSPRPAKNDNDATLIVCCLGFFVIRRGRNVPITIRANTRPALLLRLLIASGPCGIKKQQAERILWPTSVASLAPNLIDSALYRLRHLLQSERACRSDRGTILLDSNVVSIDSWLFESEADALLSRLRHAGLTEAGEIAVRVERLLELYRGPFFAADDSLPAIVQTRDRLRAKFSQAVELAGEYWQGAARWDRAQQLYEQVLTRDDVAEQTYRQIIRCHLAQGQFADAVHAFNRCRESLATGFGVAPSEETLLLYRHALNGRDNEETKY